MWRLPKRRTVLEAPTNTSLRALSDISWEGAIEPDPRRLDKGREAGRPAYRSTFIIC